MYSSPIRTTLHLVFLVAVACVLLAAPVPTLGSDNCLFNDEACLDGRWLLEVTPASIDPNRRFAGMSELFRHIDQDGPRLSKTQLPRLPKTQFETDEEYRARLAVHLLRNAESAKRAHSFYRTEQARWWQHLRELTVQIQLGTFSELFRYDAEENWWDLLSVPAMRRAKFGGLLESSDMVFGGGSVCRSRSGSHGQALVEQKTGATRGEYSTELGQPHGYFSPLQDVYVRVDVEVPMERDRAVLFHSAHENDTVYLELDLALAPVFDGFNRAPVGERGGVRADWKKGVPHGLSLLSRDIEGACAQTAGRACVCKAQFDWDRTLCLFFEVEQVKVVIGEEVWPICDR